MSEESVTVLTSKIVEERLPAMAAKRPLLPFFPSTVSILSSRMVHYPYWCVSLEATALQKLRKDQTMKLLVTVDAVTGDTARREYPGPINGQDHPERGMEKSQGFRPGPLHA
jgi:hypothetical protein